MPTDFPPERIIKGDTKIHVQSDDTIDVEVAGSADFQISANTFTALASSVIATNTINETTGATGVTIDGILLKDETVQGIAAANSLILAGGVANAQRDVKIATVNAAGDDLVDRMVFGSDNDTGASSITITEPTNFSNVDVTNLGAAGNDLVSTGNLLIATTFSGVVEIQFAGFGGLVLSNDDNPGIIIKPNSDADLGYSIFTVRNSADTQNRFGLAKDGTLSWGAGAGITDVTLGRSAANTLSLGSGDSFGATTFSGNVAMGSNAITAIGVGTTVIPTGTGTIMDFQLETEWTTGTLIDADFGGATTLTGDIIGIHLDFNSNLTPTNSDDVTGYRIDMPAFTQTSADTTAYRAFSLGAAGALVQNTNAGTINWHGIKVNLPAITATLGSIDAVGIEVDMSTSSTLAGTLAQSYGIQINGLSSATFDNHAGLYINMAAVDDSAIKINSGSLYLEGDGAVIGGGNTDSHTTFFKARDNGAGLVEVGRLQGAANPYFALGGASQFKFYNSGVADFGNAAVTNVGAAGNAFGATNTLVATTFSGAITLAAGIDLTLSDSTSELGDTTNHMRRLYGIEFVSNVVNDALYITGGRTAANTGTAFQIGTFNGADSSVSRLAITGGINTALATWSAVTHTGLVLSGAMDFNGQAATNVGAAGNAFGASNTLVATTFSGDVTIGANLLKTTNLAIKEEDAATFSTRNAANTIYTDFATGSLLLKTDGGQIGAPSGDGNYTIFKAKDTGVGSVEIARMTGAADPYFSMGGSQEFKFTNGGLMGLYGVTAVARSAGWTITNDQTDRAFDADTVAVAELADVVATLITDLAATGIIGASA